MNLGLLLDLAADAMAERVAVGHGPTALTYSQLRARSACAAQVFAGTGRARVALLAEQGPVVPVALFGSARAGLPYVPLNHRMPARVLESMLDQIAPAVVVCDSGLEALVPDRSDLTVVPSERLLDVPADEPHGASSTTDGPAVWLFTSGTSGTPKVAVLQHSHLVSYVISTVEFGSADSDEAALSVVPPFHIAGIMGILSNVYRGRRIVTLDRFDVEEWISTVEHRQITHAMVVPTMLARIVRGLEPRDQRLRSLRSVSYGGSRAPRTVVEEALRTFPSTVGLINAYGLTETSSTIALLGPEDHRDAVRAGGNPERLDSVGRPLPGVEVRIDGADGRPGVSGEILVRGEQVAGQYTHGSALDASGWLHTGDLGHLDEDGYLYVHGRRDDVIIRGGENIAPSELEDVLRGYPGVDDAAVVGLPDEEWGHRVAAAIVPSPGVSLDPRTLQEWVRHQVGGLRVPEHILIREQLPYTATGKLLRRRIREELSAELIGEDA